MENGTRNYISMIIYYLIMIDNIQLKYNMKMIHYHLIPIGEKILLIEEI